MKFMNLRGFLIMGLFWIFILEDFFKCYVILDLGFIIMLGDECMVVIIVFVLKVVFLFYNFIGNFDVEYVEEDGCIYIFWFVFFYLFNGLIEGSVLIMEYEEVLFVCFGEEMMVN